MVEQWLHVVTLTLSYYHKYARKIEIVEKRQTNVRKGCLSPRLIFYLPSI